MLSSENLERLLKVLNITVTSNEHYYLTPELAMKYLTIDDVAEMFGLSYDCISTILYYQSRSQWRNKKLFPALVQASFIEDFNWNIVTGDLREAFQNTGIEYC
jgi:hypothetical protein